MEDLFPLFREGTLLKEKLSKRRSDARAADV